MKKRFSLFAALLLCVLLPLSAFAARFPQKQEVLTNETSLLSAQTVSDLNHYAKQLQKHENLDLNVAMVYFLDGLDAQSYANGLFSAWELEDDSLLLLISAAEDSFALSMGTDVNQRMGTAASALLFTSGFSEFIGDQDYNRAIAAYFSEFNQLSALSGNISLAHLFNEPAQTGSVLPQGGTVSLIPSPARQDEDKDDGLSPAGWFFLVVLVMIVLSQSDPARKRRNRRQAYRNRKQANNRRKASAAGKVIVAAGAVSLLNHVIKQIKKNRN